MSGTTVSQFANRLLAGAEPLTMARLRPHLEFVELKRRDVLAAAGSNIRWVYFPEDAVASIVATMDDREIEIGLFGRDGMSGTSFLSGVDRPIHGTFVQIPGSAWRIELDALRVVLEKSAKFKARLVHFSYVLGVQAAETAAANALFTLEQRLARWLLMCHDRSTGGEVVITHEFISVMLGVRRPTVTLTVQILEGAGMIRATRGRIEIRNRDALVDVAGDSYGSAIREYQRILGRF